VKQQTSFLLSHCFSEEMKLVRYGFLMLLLNTSNGLDSLETIFTGTDIGRIISFVFSIQMCWY